jgi:ABC-type Mn2+/Zn2+ transport system permease subunit
MVIILIISSSSFPANGVALGVYLSLMLDLPTGATIVCTFGIVLVIMAAVRPLIQRPVRSDIHQVDYVDRAHRSTR